MHHGNQIKVNDTPKSLGMKENDVITVEQERPKKSHQQLKRE
jgi:hypothetical protein